MKRTIINIDEKKCTGCGLCITGCHEGALQLINGKAVMVSELFCDGLGACIGECPEGAITLEEREAEPYSETEVMKRLIPKGEKIIEAHLKHLQDHHQTQLFEEGVAYLKQFAPQINLIFLAQQKPKEYPIQHNGGCPGSRASFFEKKESVQTNISAPAQSELQQWPIQLHLLSPQAPYLKECDLLLAADCTAFSIGDFHSRFLKGKLLAIACPKLDQGKEIYIAKLVSMINDSHISTLTVMIMEVPCCGGLLQMAKMAIEQSVRKIPLKVITVGLQGNILRMESGKIES